jgi:hypothetical protein
MIEKTIYSRIIDFQKSMPTIKKDETNPFYKSKYAPLDSIQKAIQNPLAEAGLGYVQEATNEGLKTTLFDVDGNKIEFFYPASFKTFATQKVESKNKDKYGNVIYHKEYALNDNQPFLVDLDSQEIGSMITYAKRYALTACLGLIIEGEDDDGNTAQNSPKQEYKKPQTQTTTDKNAILVVAFGKEKGETLKSSGFKNIQITKEEAEKHGFIYNDKYDKDGKKWVYSGTAKNLPCIIDPATMKPHGGFQLSKLVKINTAEIKEDEIDINETDKYFEEESEHPDTFVATPF